jgi:putative membrane protein
MIPQADKARVTAAIRTVEARTSGEIFCVVARRSSAYALVPVAFAAMFALLMPAGLIYFTAESARIIYLAQIIVFIGGIYLFSRPQVRFRVVPRLMKHDRAHAEAMRQFWVQGVHKTAHRTGVLIFASEAERYAEIVADAGINEKVMPEVWTKAMAALVDGIKHGRRADGFVAAIEQCGAVLAEHFPLAPGEINPDELPDKLVEI